jgi:hypothetical protein
MKPKTPATFRSENSITTPAISTEQIGRLNVPPTSAGIGGSQQLEHRILQKDDSVLGRRLSN